MFKIISAAVIAASLIAGPALAQGTVSTTVTTGQPAKAHTKSHGKVAVIVKTKRHRHASNMHRARHVVVIKHKRIAKHHVKHNASTYLRVN